MSKSYKKYSIIRQEKSNKKHLHKVLRQKLKVKNIQSKELKALESEYTLRGNQHKKLIVNDSNWKYRWTKEQAIKKFKNDNRYREQFSSLDDCIQYWKRKCLRK